MWTGYDRIYAGCEPKQGVPSKAATPPPAPLAAEAASDPKVHGKAVVDFWREAGPSMWFAKDPAFDRRFREKFASFYEAAARGKLARWLEQPESALALILLLDQYPRNSDSARRIVATALPSCPCRLIHRCTSFRFTS